MSWFRSALHKAAEVGSKAAEAGSKNNLTKTVRNYAGAVYHQAGHAVAGGAKIVQDRLSGKNLNSYRDAIKRLDELSLSLKGTDRKQALLRWLSALEEIDKELKRSSHFDGEDSPKSPSSEDAFPKSYAIVFHDLDNGGVPMNFRDVFLQSHALENIVTSLIVEAPQDDEVELLLGIFGLCLTGGQEVHNALISSIQDLAKSFSSLAEDVEDTKRFDWLQMAQECVSGLKMSTESERLDAEISFLQQKIRERQGDILSNEDSNTNIDNKKESKVADEVLEHGSRIRQCLRRKEELLHTGDTAQSRNDKVEKLRELAKQLSDSLKEMQTKVSENRLQKEKALKYRDAKAQEVLENEKAFVTEVLLLEKRKEALEAELNEVKATLAAVTKRHTNTQEEQEQFDEASSKIVTHLSVQDEELRRAEAAKKAAASVAATWMSFLEDTWLLQSSSMQHKADEIRRDFDEAKRHFLPIASMNLSYHQEAMKVMLKQLKHLSDSIRAEGGTAGQKRLQEKYMEAEAQMLHEWRIIDSLEDEVEAFGLKRDGDDADEVEGKIIKSLEEISELKKEFKCLEGPEMGVLVSKIKEEDEILVVEEEEEEEHTNNSI